MSKPSEYTDKYDKYGCLAIVVLLSSSKYMENNGSVVEIYAKPGGIIAWVVRSQKDAEKKKNTKCAS